MLFLFMSAIFFTFHFLEAFQINGEEYPSGSHCINLESGDTSILHSLFLREKKLTVRPIYTPRAKVEATEKQYLSVLAAHALLIQRGYIPSLHMDTDFTVHPHNAKKFSPHYYQSNTPRVSVSTGIPFVAESVIFKSHQEFNFSIRDSLALNAFFNTRKCVVRFESSAPTSGTLQALSFIFKDPKGEHNYINGSFNPLARTITGIHTECERDNHSLHAYGLKAVMVDIS